MKKIIAAILVLGVCTPVFAAGEFQKDGSVLLGYGMPGGDVGDLIDGGVAFGLDYDGYKVNENVMIGGEFIYTGGSGTPASVDYDFTIWGLTPYAKYQKEVDLGGRKAIAYGLFGLGMYFGSTEQKAPAGFTFLDGSTKQTSDDNSVGFNLGGGIMFPLQDKMQIGFDVRYHKMGSDVSYFIPAAKFTYSF